MFSCKEDNKDGKYTKLCAAKAIAGEELLKLWLKKLTLQSALKAHRKEVAFTESEESNEVLMFARLPLLLLKGLPSMCTPLALIHLSRGLYKHRYLVRSPSSYLD